MSSFRLRVITDNEGEFLKRVDYLLDSTALGWKYTKKV